jgi:hypothetical protein
MDKEKIVELILSLQSNLFVKCVVIAFAVIAVLIGSYLLGRDLGTAWYFLKHPQT